MDCKRRSKVKIMVELFGPCARCAAKCCKNYNVYITAYDLERLLEKNENALEAVIAVRADEVKAPLAHGFFLFPKGVLEEYFLFLKRDKKENCVFLGKQNNCLIYYDRPMTCRVYPFLENEAGELEYKKGCRCPEKWKLEEKEKKEFIENIKTHQTELESHGKFCREWNATKAKKGSLKEFLEFLLEKAQGETL